MEYTAVISYQDGNNTNTKHATIEATDARTAREAAAKLAAARIENYGGTLASLRVLPSLDTPSGMMRGAVMVARRTAVNAVKRCGTPTEIRIEKEYAAINARLVGAADVDRINHVISDYSADTQDFYSVALAALYEAAADMQDIEEAYHAAYIALNRYIASLRSASEKEYSLEYIADGNGDIVAYNSVVAHILRGGDKWTEAASGDMDEATAARLGAALRRVFALLTPTQKQIVLCLGRGLSQRQTAAKMRRNVRTIEEHISKIRLIFKEALNEGEAEFSSMIDTAEHAAARQEAYIARHEENNKTVYVNARQYSSVEAAAVKHADRRTAAGRAAEKKRKATPEAREAARLRAAAWRAAKKAAAAK